MPSIFNKKFSFTELIRYQSQLPDSIEVQTGESEDGGYWIKILNLPGCFTQAETGEELFLMVNDAVYTYFDIPEVYKLYLPRYFPPEEVRKKFQIKIPAEYLQKPITFFPIGIGSISRPVQ